MDYQHLRTESDVRAVAMENPDGLPVRLTPQAVYDIAAGFALFVSKKLGKPVEALRMGIARDCRLSGPTLIQALKQGLVDVGVQVYDCGISTTPSMFMTTVTEGFLYDAAMMMTASHLPPDRNGIKFFTNEGGTSNQDVKDILTLAGAGNFPKADAPKPVQEVDFLSVYAQNLVDFIRHEANGADYERPLAPFRIVVDAGNGVGGFFVDKVLKPLGAETAGSQFLEPDGRFPNHMPNPEDDEALAAVSKAVADNHADLGIIFDTDVDRAAVINQGGVPFARNALVALMSAIVLEQYPGTTIVTCSTTSNHIRTFIENRGGKQRRFMRGYRYVIDEALRLNAAGTDSQMAIELSGHCALKENHFLDDGSYLVAKVLIKMAQLHKENKKLETLVTDLQEPLETFGSGMHYQVEDPQAYGDALMDALYIFAEEQGFVLNEEHVDGFRAEFPPGDGYGWAMIRPSMYNPLVGFNIQSEEPGGAHHIAKKFIPFFERYPELNQEDTAALYALKDEK
ncbi:phosphomannomutase/phosphoglucomutase [Eubacteriales bacterium OttesenSCG-928-M02]|nr:phosphomannomutase/phosphoglucomutase [Eubacteriales bacterium OttesenSCG-928-M02]